MFPEQREGRSREQGSLVAEAPHTITPSLPVLLSLSPTADLGTLLAKTGGISDDTHHSENPFCVLSQVIVNSTGMKLPHPGSHPKLALAKLGAADAACHRSLNDLSVPRRLASGSRVALNSSLIFLSLHLPGGQPPTHVPWNRHGCLALSLPLLWKALNITATAVFI